MDKHTEQDTSTGQRSLNRRSLLRGAATGVAAATVMKLPAYAQNAPAQNPAPAEDKPVRNGRINQGPCRWCYGRIPLEKLAAESAKMGLKCIDLVGPGDYPVLKQYGLVGSLTNSHPIDPGLNRKENHERCLSAIRQSIEAASAAGFPAVICFSGNRKGLSDEDGLKNCAEGLKQVMGLAEEKKVTVIMELLNSKVNHPDYQCDHTAWGVELCKAVGSERFKLLYDIYHMQIMEGDVIATIKKYHEYLGHYHTGGVPGRAEIDETQELNYPAIMKAILDTGYKGYVCQEFIPKRDPLTSLAQAVRLCDV